MWNFHRRASGVNNDTVHISPLVAQWRPLRYHHNRILTAALYQYTDSSVSVSWKQQFTSITGISSILESHRWVCGVDNHAFFLLQSRSGHFLAATQARQLILIYPGKKKVEEGVDLADGYFRAVQRPGKICG